MSRLSSLIVVTGTKGFITLHEPDENGRPGDLVASVWRDDWLPDLTAAHIERIEALNESYRAALKKVGSFAAYPQEFYDRNGPQWTGKDGHEYCDQDIVISLGNDIKEIVDAALHSEGMKNG